MEVCESSVLEPGAPGSSTVEPGLKRLSFAYQSLKEIPYDVIIKQRDTLEVLDLSYNLLDEILSMMNNEAAPSYFNGGSLTQYIDYRLYVISQIPSLEVLDDTEVQEKERAQARKTYRMQKSRDGTKRRKELHH
ncbi:hypothetical protein QTP86_004463 [Hemibagrus guttatus]|nr:hypothetical protein QTP86_004463 [Hemibagrus guttatus]